MIFVSPLLLPALDGAGSNSLNLAIEKFSGTAPGRAVNHRLSPVAQILELLGEANDPGTSLRNGSAKAHLFFSFLIGGEPNFLNELLGNGRIRILPIGDCPLVVATAALADWLDLKGKVGDKIREYFVAWGLKSAI